MPVSLICSHCHAPIRAREELIGRKAHCPKCRAVILIRADPSTAELADDAPIVELADEAPIVPRSTFRSPVSWILAGTVCLFVGLSIYALTKYFSTREDAGYVNARSYALKWVRKMTDDNEAELMEDTKISRLRLEEIEEGVKKDDKWAKYSKHKFAELHMVWGGRGQVWHAIGYALSKKDGRVYAFDVHMRRTRQSQGEGESWEILEFDLGEKGGKYPRIVPADQIGS